MNAHPVGRAVFAVLLAAVLAALPGLVLAEELGPLGGMATRSGGTTYITSSPVAWCHMRGQTAVVQIGA